MNFPRHLSHWTHLVQGSLYLKVMHRGGLFPARYVTPSDRRGYDLTRVEFRGHRPSTRLPCTRIRGLFFLGHDGSFSDRVDAFFDDYFGIGIRSPRTGRTGAVGLAARRDCAPCPSGEAPEHVLPARRFERSRCRSPLRPSGPGLVAGAQGRRPESRGGLGHSSPRRRHRDVFRFDCRKGRPRGGSCTRAAQFIRADIGSCSGRYRCPGRRLSRSPRGDCRALRTVVVPALGRAPRRAVPRPDGPHSFRARGAFAVGLSATSPPTLTAGIKCSRFPPRSGAGATLRPCASEKSAIRSRQGLDQFLGASCARSSTRRRQSFRGR